MNIGTEAIIPMDDKEIDIDESLVSQVVKSGGSCFSAYMTWI